MRVEAAPYVFRFEDRRQRFEERRAQTDDRRFAPEQDTPRASHRATPWIAPAFGAHLLGQVSPSRVSPTVARKAYQQPEAKTPLRPSCEAEA